MRAVHQYLLVSRRGHGLEVAFVRTKWDTRFFRDMPARKQRQRATTIVPMQEEKRIQLTTKRVRMNVRESA